MNNDLIFGLAIGLPIFVAVFYLLKKILVNKSEKPQVQQQVTVPSERVFVIGSKQQRQNIAGNKHVETKTPLRQSANSDDDGLSTIVTAAVIASTIDSSPSYSDSSYSNSDSGYSGGGGDFGGGGSSGSFD